MHQHIGVDVAKVDSNQNRFDIPLVVFAEVLPQCLAPSDDGLVFVFCFQECTRAVDQFAAWLGQSRSSIKNTVLSRRAMLDLLLRE